MDWNWSRHQSRARSPSLSFGQSDHSTSMDWICGQVICQSNVSFENYRLGNISKHCQEGKKTTKGSRGASSSDKNEEGHETNHKEGKLDERGISSQAGRGIEKLSRPWESINQ
jgi:hypothetical protein